MDDTYKENFIESVKNAQKTIYSGCMVSVVIFLLAYIDEEQSISLPFISVTTDGQTSALTLLLLHFSIGVLLCFQLKRAKTNLALIDNKSLRDAITKFPSIATGSWYTRIFSCLLPTFIFGVAMSAAFKNSFALTVLMIMFFSLPYIFASTIAQETNA